jgi:predicted nucleotidyltransferase
VSVDFRALLRALATGGVDFVVVGGVAAAIHGAARATYDVDVLYARTPANMARLVTALAPLRPYLRGAPPGLPFSWDAGTLERGLNFTLTTTAGDLDLLGEVTYGGTYDVLLPDTEIVTAFGIECRCLSLERLIQVKRAVGRVKDLDAIAELEAIAEERSRSDT